VIKSTPIDINARNQNYFKFMPLIIAHYRKVHPLKFSRNNLGISLWGKCSAVIGEVSELIPFPDLEDMKLHSIGE